MDKYTDRTQAGQLLAEHLLEYKNTSKLIILALPRGGVPIAYEIAKKLSAPLDVFIVRKLGVPGHSELAMGALASGGLRILNQELIHQLHISESSLQKIMEVEAEELLRREALYHVNGPLPSLKDKTVILVDDGIATGASIKAAIKALKKKKVKTLIVAVPVAAKETCDELMTLVDKLVCPLQPIHFYAVGLWYDNFPQTDDDEVCELLRNSQFFNS